MYTSVLLSDSYYANVLCSRWGCGTDRRRWSSRAPIARASSPRCSRSSPIWTAEWWRRARGRTAAGSVASRSSARILARHGDSARGQRRERRPPPAAAHGRRPGPRARVLRAGRLCRELGGARVLGRHRAMPGPPQAALRRRLHAEQHGRHRRRSGAPGVLHPPRRREPHPDGGLASASKPRSNGGH